MVKTIIQQNANKCVVMNRLMYPETINEREYKAVANGLIAGLIPVQTEKSKTGPILKCTVSGMVPLKSFLGSVVSKNMFLDVITQIIAVIKECGRNLLNMNNLLFDCDYVFIDSETKKVKCIFWPVIHNQNPSIWSEFFHDLPFRAVFTKGENHDYVTQYLSYFKNPQAVSINSFERLIIAIKENKPVSVAPKEQDLISTVLQESMGDTASSLSQPENANYCPQCGSEYERTAKFCSACGSPVNRHVAAQLKYLDISEVLGKSGTEEFAGGTTVLGAETFEETTFPYLLREKTQEKVSVNKPSFRIGKEKKFCDYFISNNNAISRSHADIITRDQRYYVIDNNSTNKTYVDNRPIPVNKEIEIFSGTKLRLANEEFVFYVE